MTPWHSNQTSTTSITKKDRLNRLEQYFVPNFSDVSTYLAVPIVLINFDTCAVVYLCFYWMWYVQLDDIGICIGGRFLFLPSHVSVRPPFLHQSSRKNEVLPVLIHPNKSTQNCLRPAYWISQQSTHFSPILQLYVIPVHHCKFMHCHLENANETESTIPSSLSIRH